MSCDALRPTEWKYVGWNDVFHDMALVSIFLSLLATVFWLDKETRNRRPLLWMVPALVICFVLLLTLINDCPTMTAKFRILLLVLEIFGVQL